MTTRFSVPALAVAGFFLSLVALGLHWQRGGTAKTPPITDRDSSPLDDSAALARDLRTLDARVQELERELRMHRQARSNLAADANDEPMNDASATPKELSEHVSNLLEEERQQTIDRRIAMRQQTDIEALEELSREITLSSSKKTELERVLFSVTERITILIDEGTSASRPWAEVREEMDEIGRAGLKDLQELLSPSEIELFSKISTKHGTALMIPPSQEPGEIDDVKADTS